MKPLTHGRGAMEGWISVALEDGRDIPEPVEPRRFGGRLVVRLPRTLHAEVRRVVEQEGVGLNRFVSVYWPVLFIS